MRSSIDAWSVRWDLKGQTFRLLMPHVKASEKASLWPRAIQWVLMITVGSVINGCDLTGAYLHNGCAGWSREQRMNTMNFPCISGNSGSCVGEDFVVSSPRHTHDFVGESCFSSFVVVEIGFE
ncbi:hypothetical protein A2U01_0009197 [Trifolium medium]|uniref:Uncharacterized protein n=1 Tax=Trifolium medium TaxID=97028 RepID=A0A392MM83_9FABA|nr:hypothetical protein [Trifolium medium]